MRSSERYRIHTTYRFAIPILTLVTVMAAVLLWDYTGTRFGEMYKGYAADGRTGEVVSAFVKDPAVFLTVAALLSFNVAAVASVVRAIRERQRGAGFFFILIIVNVAVFIAIMLIAIRDVAA